VREKFVRQLYRAGEILQPIKNAEAFDEEEASKEKHHEKREVTPYPD
jgi:hypothetical protein